RPTQFDYDTNRLWQVGSIQKHTEAGPINVVRVLDPGIRNQFSNRLVRSLLKEVTPCSVLLLDRRHEPIALLDRASLGVKDRRCVAHVNALRIERGVQPGKPDRAGGERKDGDDAAHGEGPRDYALMNVH